MSVRLCFVCLLAMTPQSAARCHSVDVISNVQMLINDTGLNTLDCRLYTPTIEHFQKCPSTTMNCFADEMKVLTEEWENFPYRRLRLNLKLKILSKNLNQTESDCPQCEVFEEKTAQQFLEKLISALQTMNSMKCPQKEKRRSSS